MADIVWIALFSLPFAYIGVRTLKKAPSSDAYFLGSTRQDVSASGTCSGSTRGGSG